MFRIALRRGSLISRGLLNTYYSCRCLVIGNRDHLGSHLHDGNGIVNFQHWSGNSIGTETSLYRTMTSHSSTNTAIQPEVVPNDDKDSEQKQSCLSWLLETGAVLVMIGAGFFALDEWYGNKKKIMKRIQKGIQEAKCSGYVVPEPCMERKELSENLQWCLCNPTPNEVWPMTTIVYGPCGSGKRTAVRNILKDQEAVIHLKLQHFEDDPRKEIVNSILRQVSPSSLCKPSLKDDYEKCRALESALESMRNKNPRVVPTFFIEAPFYGHDCVLELLQLLKQWVNKRRLVNAVVVLSPDNEIGDALVHHDMRAHVVKIDHLTMDETKDYLLGICKQKELTGSQEEREQLAKELAPIIGNRLWDLQDLANVVPKGGTLHDLKMLTHKQAEDLERIFENALWWNLAFFMKNDVKIDEFNMVLQKLLTDKGAHLYEFLKFYNYQKEKSNKRSHQKIWDEIADERASCEGVLSCVFYVDPTSLKVTVWNPFTRKALEKRLKKMP